MKKFGFFGPERIQRYRCKQCGQTVSDFPKRPLDEMRIPLDTAVRAVHLLVEGVGIRASERLTGLHRDTILSLLETAGAKCARLLDLHVRNVKAETVQVDEMWSYVLTKQKQASECTQDIGDQYIYLALEGRTKLILSHVVGKRDNYSTGVLMRDLRSRIVSSFQMTTDGFAPYRHAVPEAFDEHRVDFAQLQKIYSPVVTMTTAQRAHLLPKKSSRCIGSKKIVIMGSPHPDEISTSYIERQNLSMRLFNRRLTRLTLGFSKTLANLKHSVALQVAYHNFCRVHSAHGKTPAMAAGITDRPWTIKELLTA